MRRLLRAANQDTTPKTRKFAAILRAQYTTASFPQRPEHPRGRIEKIISEMNRDRTWHRLVGIVSLVSLCFLGLAVFDKTSAQQQQPTVRGKSKGAVPAEDIASLLHEAALLLQAGKLDEAEPLVRRAVAEAPSNADAHNLLGVILDQRGNMAQAEREYRIALRLNPNGVSATANLGVLLARSKRDDEAIKTFET